MDLSPGFRFEACVALEFQAFIFPLAVHFDLVSLEDAAALAALSVAAWLLCQARNRQLVPPSLERTVMWTYSAALTLGALRWGESDAAWNQRLTRMMVSLLAVVAAVGAALVNTKEMDAAYRPWTLSGTVLWGLLPIRYRKDRAPRSEWAKTLFATAVFAYIKYLGTFMIRKNFVVPEGDQRRMFEGPLLWFNTVNFVLTVRASLWRYEALRVAVGVITLFEVEVVDIFPAPHRMASVRSVWRNVSSNRQEIIHERLVAPLRQALGAGGSLLYGFVVSAVMHTTIWEAAFGAEVVPSVLTFFAIQPLLIILESIPVMKIILFHRVPVLNSLLTSARMIIALPLLFRPAIAQQHFPGARPSLDDSLKAILIGMPVYVAFLLAYQLGYLKDTIELRKLWPKEP
jgi:hypothetical protein